MGKNIKRLFLAAGLLAVTGSLLAGCGTKNKKAETDSVIRISTAPEPTVTPTPAETDPAAVTTNGDLTMVNEYLAQNGPKELGIDSASVTPAPSDTTESADNTDSSQDAEEGDGNGE